MFMMIYDRPPYFPLKEHGYGINGITRAVNETTHRFDPKIPISDDCKSFINICLEKNPSKRASMEDLKRHKLFNSGIVSVLRKGYIADSLNVRN